MKFCCTLGIQCISPATRVADAITIPPFRCAHRGMVYILYM